MVSSFLVHDDIISNGLSVGEWNDRERKAIPKLWYPVTQCDRYLTNITNLGNRSMQYVCYCGNDVICSSRNSFEGNCKYSNQCSCMWWSTDALHDMACWVFTTSWVSDRKKVFVKCVGSALSQKQVFGYQPRVPRVTNGRSHERQLQTKEKFVHFILWKTQMCICCRIFTKVVSEIRGKSSVLSPLEGATKSKANDKMRNSHKCTKN